MRRYQQFLRRLRHKTLQHHIRSQALYVLGNQFDVLVHAVDVERLALVHLGQLGASDNLHLMNLQNVDGQLR